MGSRGAEESLNYFLASSLLLDNFKRLLARSIVSVIPTTLDRFRTKELLTKYSVEQQYLLSFALDKFLCIYGLFVSFCIYVLIHTKPKEIINRN